jgi:hypothetical protein
MKTNIDGKDFLNAEAQRRTEEHAGKARREGGAFREPPSLSAGISLRLCVEFSFLRVFIVAH